MKTTNLDILIVEDSVMFAEGLEANLIHHQLIRSISHVTEYGAMLDHLNEHSVDIIILDLSFDTNQYDGFIIAKKLKDNYPDIKVIILSQSIRVRYYKELFEDCEVKGYLDKQLSVEEAFEAIDVVAHGGVYVDKNILAQLEIAERGKFTEREEEVMELLASGLTQKEIADKLHVSPRTIESRIQKLFLKFEVKNTVELIAKYIRYKNGNRDNGEQGIPPFKQ